MQSQTWTKQFPPMPTARCSTSAFTHNRWLVVEGGQLQEVGSKLSDVEILDTMSGQWYCCPSLPQPCTFILISSYYCMVTCALPWVASLLIIKDPRKCSMCAWMLLSLKLFCHQLMRVLHSHHHQAGDLQ